MTVSSFAKPSTFRSQTLRDSARGQDCTLEIPDVCNHNPETVVLAHVQTEGGAMGMKAADDFSACFACNDCHDLIDGRAPNHYVDDLEWYTLRAIMRTHRVWFNDGTLTVNR